MGWTGKVVGVMLGLATGLGVVGALIGLIIGHAFDESQSGGFSGSAASPAEVRATFFRSAFAIMGWVAKSDGRVSEQDIAAARQVFRQFRLGEADTRAAIEHFSRGKSAQFDPDAALTELRRVCGGRHDLLRVFLEIQMRAALLGNGMQGAPRTVLGRMAGALGVSALEFAHLEAVLRMQGYGAAYGAGGFRPGSAGPDPGAGYRAPPPQPRNTMAEAYEVLEVKPEASDAEVKRAYRKQMSQNHPDKLVARGLPESMMELAKERTQAIQSAWETIREARGIR